MFGFNRNLASSPQFGLAQGPLQAGDTLARARSSASFVRATLERNPNTQAALVARAQAQAQHLLPAVATTPGISPEGDLAICYYAAQLAEVDGFFRSAALIAAFGQEFATSFFALYSTPLLPAAAQAAPGLGQPLAAFSHTPVGTPVHGGVGRVSPAVSGTSAGLAGAPPSFLGSQAPGAPAFFGATAGNSSPAALGLLQQSMGYPSGTPGTLEAQRQALASANLPSSIGGLVRVPGGLPPGTSPAFPPPSQPPSKPAPGPKFLCYYGALARPPANESDLDRAIQTITSADTLTEALPHGLAGSIMRRDSLEAFLVGDDSPNEICANIAAVGTAFEALERQKYIPPGSTQMFRDLGFSLISRSRGDGFSGLVTAFAKAMVKGREPALFYALDRRSDEPIRSAGLDDARFRDMRSRLRQAERSSSLAPAPAPKTEPDEPHHLSPPPEFPAPFLRLFQPGGTFEKALEVKHDGEMHTCCLQAIVASLPKFKGYRCFRAHGALRSSFHPNRKEETAVAKKVIEAIDSLGAKDKPLEFSLVQRRKNSEASGKSRSKRSRRN